MLDMRLSARADYALRAAIELAATERNHITAEQLARAQSIPGKFLEAILTQLRRAGLVRPAVSRSAWPERLPVVALTGYEVGLNRKVWANRSSSTLPAAAAAERRPATEGNRQ